MKNSEVLLLEPKTGNTNIRNSIQSHLELDRGSEQQQSREDLDHRQAKELISKRIRVAQDYNILNNLTPELQGVDNNQRNNNNNNPHNQVDFNQFFTPAGCAAPESETVFPPNQQTNNYIFDSRTENCLIYNNNNSQLNKISTMYQQSDNNYQNSEQVYSNQGPYSQSQNNNNLQSDQYRSSAYNNNNHNNLDNHNNINNNDLYQPSNPNLNLNSNLYQDPDHDHELEADQEALNRATFAKAKLQLEQARFKSVAFSVKTNISYNATFDDDPAPLPGHSVSFDVNDYLHIKEKFNNDWWIGRMVREGCDVGFIPTPMKLEALRVKSLMSKSAEGASAFGGANNGTNNGRNQSNYYDDEENDSLNDDPNIRQSSYSKLNSEEAIKAKARLTSDNSNGDQPAVREQPRKKSQSIFKKQDIPPPYDVVPSMRPVVLVGPSLKGYEVTDMIQKAIFDFIKTRFQGRVSITRVQADISLAKKSMLNPNKRKMEKNMSKANNMVEIQAEIERIFELGRSLQLVVLDADTVNHPQQLAKTNLAPIMVYLKIANLKVLQRLIKNRGKSQTKSMNMQLVGAEKLAQCNHELFDIVLDENRLEDACDHLSEYLEAYWRATHLSFGHNIVEIPKEMEGLSEWEPQNKPKINPEKDVHVWTGLSKTIGAQNGNSNNANGNIHV